MNMLLCDHAAECGQKCKHATAHESYGKQCENSALCVHVKVNERTVCKPLDEEQKTIPFPNCAKGCPAVEYFGVCECESICSHKFDSLGQPLEVKEEKP
jgi:hypothetical protein